MLSDVTSPTPELGTYNSKTSVRLSVRPKNHSPTRNVYPIFKSFNDLPHIAQTWNIWPSWPLRPAPSHVVPLSFVQLSRLSPSPILNLPFRPQESVYLGGTCKTVD